MKLVFATHNQNKIDEVKKIIPQHITLLSLTDIGCFDEIPETGATLEENAQIKADYVTEHFNLDCFADDTGLIITSLNGEPGVYSARYAGEEKNSDANMNKVLNKLMDKTDRSAYFKTVIALNIHDKKHLFDGIVQGRITKEKTGTKGFGYDPIFTPDGYTETFAELPLEIKNHISHRGRAIKKLIDFLQ